VLLAIDTGNTETVVGVFRGDELSLHWRSSTREDRTADELTLLIGGFLEREGLTLRSDVDGMVVASVVPAQTQALREVARNAFAFAPVVVEPGTRTGISILYDNPKDVGADRIANAVGAPTVVATGGLAPLVVDHCASVQHHEPWLTLEGLRLIFERNAARDG